MLSDVIKLIAMIKVFLALNTSKNNTYSGFKKEMTEEGHAYREHRQVECICLCVSRGPACIGPGSGPRQECLNDWYTLDHTMILVSAAGECHSTVRVTDESVTGSATLT